MLCRDDDGVGCGCSSSTRIVVALKARASRQQSRRGRCSGVGEVGTRGWAARRGAGGSAQSCRGASMSRVRERERAGEDGRGRRLPGNGVSAVMTGHFKVNGVGTLWLRGNDEVMAKEVGAAMIVWELWRGTLPSRRE